jgi:hypothetical protein
MRAWRKANAYVRSGQHAKAIYWFSRTQALLDSEPRRPMRADFIEVSYMLGGLARRPGLVWMPREACSEANGRNALQATCAGTHDGGWS